MAKRFGSTCPKVGSVVNSGTIVHRFVLEDVRYYVVRTSVGDLVVVENV